MKVKDEKISSIKAISAISVSSSVGYGSSVSRCSGSDGSETENENEDK